MTTTAPLPRRRTSAAPARTEARPAPTLGEEVRDSFLLLGLAATVFVVGLLLGSLLRLAG